MNMPFLILEEPSFLISSISRDDYPLSFKKSAADDKSTFKVKTSAAFEPTIFGRFRDQDCDFLVI